MVGVLCFPGVDDAMAQNASTYCQSYSDVRPNPWSQSPRERCEAACNAGNCPNAPDSNSGSSGSGTAGSNPNYPNCSSCGKCDSHLANYNRCVNDLRARCGSGEYDHCTFRERSYTEWVWTPIPIRRRYYQADCIFQY